MVCVKLVPGVRSPTLCSFQVWMCLLGALAVPSWCVPYLVVRDGVRGAWLDLLWA